MKKRFGLLGYPLEHSFSARFFSEKFKKEHISAEYLNFERENLDGIRDWMLQETDLCGFNVTIPYKQTIIPYLDTLSDEAQAIGAVNVVKIIDIDGKKKFKGYNTDVIGFTKTISSLKSVERALVLGGTGGAAKAIVYGLQKKGIECTLVSREKKESQKDIKYLIYEEVDASVLSEHLLIVNCTPLGMYPNIDVAPKIPYQSLTSNHILYDLIYNPLETKFLKLGRKYGAAVKNGLEMLHLQALAAWDIWIKEDEI